MESQELTGTETGFYRPPFQEMLKWTSTTERFDVKNLTHRVNFRTDPPLTDPFVADACIEVLTSDGKEGTLSHLYIGNNPELFAQDLRELLGKDGIPICLSGGLENVEKSRALAGRLIQSLKDAGFAIGQTDLLGRYSRQSTLYPDKVIVRRRSYENGQFDTRELKFTP